MCLPLVDLHDRFPVGGDFGESIVAAQVHEVQNILLEAATAKADGGLEELRADTAVLAHHVGDLVHVGTGLFAEGADGVDGADALGQEGVRGELRELGAPEVRREDAVARHPVGVHVHELLAGGEARFRLVGANEHPIGLKQVVDGGAFSKELGVRKNLKMQTLVVAVQNAFHRGGGTDRERRLFDDDLALVGDFKNIAGRLFPVLQVGSLAGTVAEGLRRGVHGNEDDVRFLDGGRDVRAEEEVAAAGALHHVVEAGFKNREIVAVPGIDTGLVDIDYGNLHIGALVGNTKNLGIVVHDA